VRGARYYSKCWCVCLTLTAFVCCCNCRWVSGLKPAGYIDQHGLTMYGATLIATGVRARMAVSRPHSNALVVFDHFPKEAYYAAVVKPFLPRKPTRGTFQLMIDQLACMLVTL
jgi:hypothetical protein